MPYQAIPMALKLGKGRSSNVSIENLVNMYAEKTPDGSKFPVVVHGAPGLKLWGTFGSGPIRALQKLGTRLFVLSGTELYVVDGGKTGVLLGTIPGTGHVPSIANGSAVTPEVGFLLPNELYVATTSTLATTGQSGFSDITYQDGYAIMTDANAELWQISAIDDMSTWSGLDFSAADTFGDDLVGFISDHRELWLFGKESIEIWQNVGSAAFPFARATIIETGCLSRDSIAKANNSVFWLGHDFVVYEASGYQPRAISNPWVNQLIREAAGADVAKSWVYSIEGHTCYVISFSDLSLVYDTSTGFWHERQTYDKVRWRAQESIYQFSTNLVGDSENGNVYELDVDTYTDSTDPLIRTMQLPPIHGAGHRLSMSRLFTDFEGGVGLTSGQGSDPLAMMVFSDDQGNTWSNEVTASIGQIGEYSNRAMWNRCGHFTDRTYRISVSDPVKVSIVGTYAEMERRL